MPELVKYSIVLLNGACTEPKLLRTPEGIRYGSLMAAMADSGTKGLLPDVTAGRDGAFIYVPEGVKAQGVFVVENRFTWCGCAGACECTGNDTGGAGSRPATESVVLLMNGASATVQYEVRCDAAGASSDSRHIRLGDGAKLRFEEIVSGADGRDGDSNGRVSVDSFSLLGEGAVMDAVTVELRCAEASLKYKTDLAGRGAQAVHAGLFVTDGEEKADFDVAVNHLVADCRSDVLIKGVAGANARGSFSGLVYVAQDAQHTEAYQQSRNLLMSETAQIVTSPQLEIYADDVKCSHGATVGQMNDDAIYYMRQRGLSEEQARGLHMAGFVNDIISRIGDEEKRQFIFNSLNMNFEL